MSRMNQFGTSGPLLVVVLLLLFLAIGISMPSFLMGLIINSLIGVLLILIINFLPQIEIPINIWTILIAALGGIPGVLLLVILDLLHIKLE